MVLFVTNFTLNCLDEFLVQAISSYVGAFIAGTMILSVPT